MNKPRYWGKEDTLFGDITLDEALRLAEIEAKRRNIVLYVTDKDCNCKIRWHPNGWEPVEG